GAGLMLQTFARMLRAERGFEPAHLVAATLDYSVSGFTTWVRTVFAYRRKVLPRALMDTGLARDAAEAACRAAGLDPGRRLESLDAPELIALSTRLPS
ncbi:MAG: hypothetical protein J0M00_16190, partial [Burkholderiales bacterium]|nr:hypothetical protein [Burkholderiales bacterium]